LFIFFRVEENEPKEDARVPRRGALPCASSTRPERAETRPAFAKATAGFRQVRALFPTVTPMLGAGQREIESKIQNHHFTPLRG
jgi:hypothetical protein